VALAREARLAVILRVALARNPALDEGRLRVEAAGWRARAEGHLPSPELKYEQWGVPLDRPLALGRADTLMLGVRQAFPAWGTRTAQVQVAGAEVGGAEASLHGRRVELGARVRAAFAEYARTEREIELHRAHVTLMARMVELGRTNYQSGQATQQDVLRLTLELSRLHADLAHLEEERRSSAALLNALMDRPPGTPLGPPVIAAAAPVDPAVTPDQRGDLRTARQAVARSEAALALARQAAWWPTLMVGLDYWYMPREPQPHAYGAMVTVGLPWIGRGADEREAADRALRADQRALESVRAMARYEVEDARAHLEGAESTLAIVERDLLPQARRAVEAAQRSFAIGQGDAAGLLDSLRTSLQVQIDDVRAAAAVARARAELDRVAGREATP
jgi:cobalt-zinc-cadmium efflux system outer membrane protein